MLTVPGPHLEPFTALLGAAGLKFTVTAAEVVLVQLPALAVIVNIVVCGLVVLFVKVPPMELPVPFGAMPERFIVLVLVQLKVLPATLFGLETSICIIAVPEHIF